MTAEMSAASAAEKPPQGLWRDRYYPV